MPTHQQNQLPVLLESASISSPGSVWYMAGQRVQSYLLALGIIPATCLRLTLRVIGKAALNPRWATQGNALDIAMLELQSLLDSTRQRADSSDELDKSDQSIVVRLRFWLSGIPVDLEESNGSTHIDAPLYIDNSGRVRLESTPKMERMHMVAADIRRSLLHRFWRRFFKRDA